MGQKFIHHLDKTKIEDRIQKRNVYMNRDRKDLYLFQSTQLNIPSNNTTWDLVQDYMRVNQIERSVLDSLKNTFDNGFVPRMTKLTSRWNSFSYKFRGDLFKE